MLHVQLSQRGQVVRAFNLSDEDVQSQFVAPLLGGRMFEYAGHEWEGRKARLRIIDGRELAPNELMVGRGWSNAEKFGQDVTERFLDQARAQASRRDAVQRLGERIVGGLAAGPVTLAAAASLADDLVSGQPDEARRAVTAQAAWELLHRDRAEMLGDDGERLARDQWESTLLGWVALPADQATTSSISLARSGSVANR